MSLKKVEKEKQFSITVKINMSERQTEALSVYLPTFQKEITAKVQDHALQLLNKLYAKKVPPAVREFIELCEKEDDVTEEDAVANA